MAMMEALQSGAIGGGIALAGQVIFYLVFSRRDDVRDREVRALQEELNELKGIRLKKIEDAIERDSDKRGGIYKRMENELVTRRECAAMHERQNDRFEEIQTRLNGFGVEQSDTNKTLSKVLGIVEMIASRLQISLGDKGKESAR